MIKFWQKLKKEQGFTLIEVILYLAIVGIVLVAVVDFHFTLGGTSTKLAANIDASNNKRTAINAIEYLIRNSDGLLKDVDEVSCSDLVSDPPTLALYFKNDSYLPGTCVQNGGGVRITASSTLQQITLSCHPNIVNNGRYQACSTSAFPVGNTYYLTSPEVRVLPTDLNFVTSTPTTTQDSFLAINTILSIGSLSDQSGSMATSTASSTVMMRSSWFDDNSFTGWWTMNDSIAGTATNARGANGTCTTPSLVGGGLVNGFVRSEDFERTEGDYCILGVSGTTRYNFKDGFTLAAWSQPEGLSEATHYIFSQYYPDSNLGYAFGTNNAGYSICTVCNGVTCSTLTDTFKLNDGTVYHLACVYNPHSTNVLKIYVFEEGKTGKSTTTNSTLIYLANAEDPATSNDLLAVGTSTATVSTQFDGILNDLRAYSRPLKDWEIWALQSRGYTAN